MKRKYLKDQGMFVKEENIKERWKSFLLEAILDIEMNSVTQLRIKSIGSFKELDKSR